MYVPSRYLLLGLSDILSPSDVNEDSVTEGCIVDMKSGYIPKFAKIPVLRPKVKNKINE